jgi:hypothetical protein
MSSYSHADYKRERQHSSYTLLTSALNVVSGQPHVPAAIYPRGRTPVPTVQEAEWASELVWTQKLEEKSFVSAGDRTTFV